MRNPHHRLQAELRSVTPPPATPATSGFMMHPMASLSQMQLELYRWALAQAQAVVRPSILERDLLGSWN